MDRIENHPILGETPKRKKVTFSYNGEIMKDMKVSQLQQHSRQQVLWLTDIQQKHMSHEVFSVRLEDVQTV